MLKKSSFGLLIFFILLAGCTQKTNQESRSTPSQRAKNIILMIGDGMGTTQVYSGLIANHGELNLQHFPITGFSKTYSADNLITDSAAGATAFSTGHKTKNGAVGVDPNGKPVPTILETASKNGLASGLVVTCSVTHATPACFVAHETSRNMTKEIAADFLNSGIDVFIGGGRQDFEKRDDGRNLLNELTQKGYQVVTDQNMLENIHVGKLAALITEGHLPKELDGRGDYLPNATEKALELLSKNEKGFFLMVEGSQIDWGGHDNDTDYITSEMLDFDHAVGKALDFAQSNGETLVIVTADHETGGFAIVDGNIKEGKVEGKFTTEHHTAVMVPVFAYGPQSDQFSGIFENTSIYNKMMSAFGF